MSSKYYTDFWRSCDAEDWSNDAENTDLITEINYILQYINIENRFLFFIIILFFYCIFYQINVALLSKKKLFFKNNKK